MNQKIKDIAGIAAVIVFLAFGYAAVRYVAAYSASIQPSSFRSFAVDGEGKVVAVPDIAAFSFSVVTEGGKNLADLQAKNTASVNRAIDFVKSKGVDSKDIKTQQYNLEPRYQTYNCNPYPYPYESQSQPVSAPVVCPPSEIVGYTITQSVEVKIRDFSKIGDIVSGVVDNGANRVGALSFRIDDPERVKSEARIEAIQKAQEKAKQVARAGGFSVGRLLSIDEGGVVPYYRDYGYAEGVGGGGVAAKAAPAPVIEPGSQDVTVNVTLRYEIK